jgi:hypothetical protein
MPDAPITAADVVESARQVARVASIPVRENSVGRPSFRSKPISHNTKCRPIPANSPFIDYVFIQGGRGSFPAKYSAVIQYVIATGKNDMATSGLSYRWMLEGDLLPLQYIAYPAGIDQFVDRTLANPWPSQARRVHIIVTNGQSLSLQVQNTSGSIQLAYAGFFGFYYQNLGSLDKDAFSSSGNVQDDTVREMGVR